MSRKQKPIAANLPARREGGAVAKQDRTLPAPAAPRSAASRAERTAGWSAGRSLLTGFLAIAILAGGFGSWAVASSLAGAIIAPGRFAVASNRQVVQHPDGGVVSTAPVKEGDRVEAGQVLMTLDSTFLASEIAVAQARLGELRARRARLEAERDDAAAIAFPDDLLSASQDNADLAEFIDGQQRLFAARAESRAGIRTQLDRRIEQTQAQIEGIGAQSAALEQQLSLIEEELASSQKLLDDGLARAPQVLALRREAARLAGQVGELAASRGQAEAQITETELQSLNLGAQAREEAITELRDIRAEEVQLAEQLRAAEARSDRLAITAPVSGVIYGLTVFGPGSVVRAAEPVAYVVPQDDALVIEARVEPINIDSVYPGQPVRLVLSAFDTRTTPPLDGSVRHVSPDAFNDERSGQAYYRAEITLDEGQTDLLDEAQVLIPGMPVEAFIRTADRTPLAYLTQPLVHYFQRAFRDG